MRLCGLLLLLLLLLAAPSTQAAAKRSRPKKTRARTSKKALAKAAREAEAREQAAFNEALERDASAAAVESWLRPALQAALDSTGGDLGQTGRVLVDVTLTGAQIKDDLKALGWEGFTADADQAGGQVAAASACDPNGVTQKGWTEDPSPQSPLPVVCNGCIQDYTDRSNKGCGCYDGYCWSTCSGATPLFFGTWLFEWCYTNRPGGYSQDFRYKRCTKNSDCTFHDVQCAGSCTV